MEKRQIKVLGISGSINPGATAARLLQALNKLAGDVIQLTIFEGLGGIPHFNPQQAETTDSEAVAEWRQFWKDSDAVVICSPEYAFGMPGVLKDALDWLVSTGEVYKKPLAAISYSPSAMGGEHALSTLLLTMTAQNADFDEHTTLKVPFVRKRFTLEGEIIDAELKASLEQVLKKLLEKVSLDG